MFPVSFAGTMEGSLCSPIRRNAYFGEHTQVTLTCPGCGWRQTDFIPAEAREGACQSYHIDSAEDLQIRVIRGSACTVDWWNWIWRCALVHTLPDTYQISRGSESISGSHRHGWEAGCD
ncbi:MAG: hypothetical protein Ct9H90mP16_19980 [Candidatus Poseidoniales archaeon]|nr:MAG: hypothetical protein Ct9H90mP16_19980 [Candidatus Poseidoniales archaeon]